MGKAQYSAAQFVKAIEGSGGIVSTIASRVGCTWMTAKKYIDSYPTIRTAYDEEIERIIDLAEGVLIKNIQNAAKEAQVGRDVDTADAKWFLSRKAKSRGYVERQEVTGADGGKLQIEYVNDWRGDE